MIKHPSILVIKNKNDRQRFNFCSVSIEDDVKESKKLSLKKADQASDIPVKILKQTADIICMLFNECIDQITFDLF